VLRSVTANGPYTTIKTGLTTTNYVDTTVTNGTVYYYVIAAVNGGVEVTDSDEVTAIPSAGVPSPWSTKDIGMVIATGGAHHSNGTFNVVGSGDDIWNNEDQFRYVYQLASGDCTVVARVGSIGNTDQWAKAGVMIRESLNANSRHASTFVTPANGVAFQWRNSTGGSSGNSNTSGLTAPQWLRIVRVGNTFTSFYSATGASGTWITLGTQSISMGSSVYIGLGVTSHSGGNLCPAVFSNVTATP
jgi:hypothetical protein